ncbi:unnamed protein product, partial [Meganyctiphanes norvegica]
MDSVSQLIQTAFGNYEPFWVIGCKTSKIEGFCLKHLFLIFILLTECVELRKMSVSPYKCLTVGCFTLLKCLELSWAGIGGFWQYNYSYLEVGDNGNFSGIPISLLCISVYLLNTIDTNFHGPMCRIAFSIIWSRTPLKKHLGLISLLYVQNKILETFQDDNWLQSHAKDDCTCVCVYIPMLRKVLLPRVNPLILISLAGFFSIIADHMIIQIYNYQAADMVAALLIAGLTITTMFPLALCSGQILLQTTPYSVVGQLDTRLREALTLDGVLEFRNESFWTLGIGATAPVGKVSGSEGAGIILAGSLHVRVRRNANEQIVLAHVKERLRSLVPLLTVQVFKDDWTRNAATLQLLHDSGRPMASPVTPSHSPHYVNVTYPPQTPLFSDQYPMSPFYPMNPSSPWMPVGTPTPSVRKTTSFPSERESNKSMLAGYSDNSANDNLYNQIQTNNIAAAYNRQNINHFNKSSLDGSLNKSPLNTNHEEPIYSNLSVISGSANITSPNLNSPSWNGGTVIPDDTTGLDTRIRSTASPQLQSSTQKPSPYYVNLEFLQKNKVNNESSSSYLESSDMIPR